MIVLRGKLGDISGEIEEKRREKKEKKGKR
jgi:hypothetical protein